MNKETSIDETIPIDDDSAHPASGKALKRERKQRKLIEQTLRKREAEIEKLRREKERLEKENEKLRKELILLRGVPDWVKPNLNPEDKPRPKKVGAKKGHKPNLCTIPLGEPDIEVSIEAEKCPNCETLLGEAKRFHNHTQIDLPELQKPIVTKFQVGWTYCPCCKKEVSAGGRLTGTKYGPRLHAQVAAWKFESGLTLGKISKLLNSQFGLLIGTGQLSEILKRGSEMLSPYYDGLKTQLRQEKHLHADETGWRVEGNNEWLWSFSNANISVYVIERTRGQVVVEEVLGETWDGVLVSDFYGGYNAIDCEKQKCWAHLLRELHDLKAKSPDDEELKKFSNRLKVFFDRGKTLAVEFQQGKDVEKPCKRLYDDTLRFSLGQFKGDDTLRLAKRLQKYRSELYTFIKHGIDPTNNAAEREVRPAVLMRKTSYGNRSTNGKETQAVMMSVIRTCQKRGDNFLTFASTYLGAN